MLEDPNPLVRAHASRTAAAIAPVTAAPYVVPLLSDRSWWVREAAREALVAGGRDVAPSVERALHDADATLEAAPRSSCRTSAFSTTLVNEDDLGRLERILDAGGSRLRDAANGSGPNGNPSRSGAVGRRGGAFVTLETVLRAGVLLCALYLCLVYASYLGLMLVGYFESRRRRRELSAR